MKMHMLIKTFFIGLLLVSGSMANAADFQCFPANIKVPTTDAIKALLDGSMPLVVREGKNRKSTLTKVTSVTSTGCFITVKFDAKLERKKKAIKKKRVVTGHATFSAEVNRFSGCLMNPKFDALEYANTTKITEGLIRAIYNKRLPDQICPSADGSFNL